MPTLLAVDPGQTTGASLWFYDQEKALQPRGHWQVEGGVIGFLEFLEFFDQIKIFMDDIVSESFVLDGQTPNPDVMPLKIEGALMAYSQMYKTPVFFQRNNFKKHVSNELLKQHDLYWKGEQHAMDSARHALAFMKVNRHMPTLRKYFGDNAETPGN